MYNSSCNSSRISKYNLLFLIFLSSVIVVFAQSQLPIIQCLPGYDAKTCQLESGDVFTYSTTPTYYNDANSQCQSVNGWLAMPNQPQISALINYGMLNNNTWINGFREYGSDEFQYSKTLTSPLADYHFYNILTRRCKTWCYFNDTSIVYSQNDIMSTGVAASRLSPTESEVTFNALINVTQLHYICQYLNTNNISPNVTGQSVYTQNTVPTVGGPIDLYWLTPNEPVDDPNVTDSSGQSLLKVKKVSNTIYEYEMPGGTGHRKYFTNYTDITSAIFNNTLDFYYEPPYLSYFSYSLSGQGEMVITIVGENFGEASSNIFVHTNSDLPCTGVEIIDTYAISCISQSSNFFVSIKVTVSGISTTAYSLPLVYNKRAYQIVQYNTNWEDSVELASELTCGSLKGYVGLITDSADHDMVSKLYNLGYYPSLLLEGFTWKDGIMVYSDGPNDGDELNQIYGTFTFGGRRNNDRYLYDITTSNVYNLTETTLPSTYSVLVQYYQQTRPTFTVSATDGAAHRVTIEGYGTYFSNITFVVKGEVVQYARSVVSINSLDIILPNGSGPEDIVVYVEGIRIDDSPYIDDVFPLAVSSETTPNVTITGGNFFNQSRFAEDPKVYLGLVELTYSVVDNATLVVTIPIETDSSTIYIKRDNLKSNEYIVYQVPVIHGDYLTNATSIDSGYVRFEISNISTTASNVTLITLTNNVIPNVQILNPTELLVAMPAGDTKYEFYLYVNGRRSANWISYNNLPEHFKIDSIQSVYYQQPGNVTLIGSGLYNDRLSVSIGSVDCDYLYSISQEKLICYFRANAPQPNNGDALSVIIRAFHMEKIVFNQSLFYYLSDYNCPNNCSNVGICVKVTGSCICPIGWGLRDCSLKLSNQTVPKALPETNDKGVAIINGAQLSFRIGISHLREVDENGNIVKYVSLNQIQWVQPKQGLYIGTFKEIQCRIELHVDYYNTSTDIQFAGENITMDADSVKFTVNISNWEFKSALNVLQVIYQTKAAAENGEPLCDSYIPQEYSDQDSEGSSGNSSLTYFQIKTTNSIFQARFARRIILESRNTNSNVRQLSLSDPLYREINTTGEFNLLTAVSAPYFTTYCIIDPNFSVLLTGKNEQVGCGTESNRWKVPVIVVCSVVGAIIIVTVTALIVKKRLQGRRLRDVVTYKLRKLKK